MNTSKNLQRIQTNPAKRQIPVNKQNYTNQQTSLYLKSRNSLIKSLKMHRFNSNSNSETNLEPKRLKTTKASKAQKLLLADFVEANPMLLYRSFSPQFTFKQANRMWQGIADELNAIPGSRKDHQRWRKCWQDLKKDARKKAAKQKRFESSGHSGDFKDVLTNFDKRVLSIVDKRNLSDKELATQVFCEEVHEEEDEEIHEVVQEEVHEEPFDIKLEQEGEEYCLESEKIITSDPLPYALSSPLPSAAPLSLPSKKPAMNGIEQEESFHKSFDKIHFIPIEKTTESSLTTQKTIEKKPTSDKYIKRKSDQLERKTPQNKLTSDEYMRRKLDLLERNTKANEDIARAQERKAAATEKIAADFARISKTVARISNSFKKN